MLQQPELLAPAGSLETLKYAVMYGADAVYCALPEFGMRAAPVNLTVGELREGCIFAHARGKKVYLTLNTLPTNEELSKLPQYIQDAAEAGVDAFIIADLGVLALAKKYAPQVERHVSTQAGITNYEAAKVCYELGAKRVVLARELPLTEIAQIRDNCPADLELEAFVHGAMCISYSGRCTLSNHMSDRDANRGGCAQICRWEFPLYDKNNNMIESETKFTASSKDLMMLTKVKEEFGFQDADSNETLPCNNKMLDAFLNGLITFKRGPQEKKSGQPENPINAPTIRPQGMPAKA